MVCFWKAWRNFCVNCGWWNFWTLAHSCTVAKKFGDIASHFLVLLLCKMQCSMSFSKQSMHWKEVATMTNTSNLLLSSHWWPNHANIANFLSKLWHHWECCAYGIHPEKCQLVLPTQKCHWGTNCCLQSVHVWCMQIPAIIFQDMVSKVWVSLRNCCNSIEWQSHKGCDHSEQCWGGTCFECVGNLIHKETDKCNHWHTTPSECHKALEKQLAGCAQMTTNNKLRVSDSTKKKFQSKHTKTSKLEPNWLSSCSVHHGRGNDSATWNASSAGTLHFDDAQGDGNCNFPLKWNWDNAKREEDCWKQKVVSRSFSGCCCVPQVPWLSILSCSPWGLTLVQASGWDGNGMWQLTGDNGQHAKLSAATLHTLEKLEPEVNEKFNVLDHCSVFPVMVALDPHQDHGFTVFQNWNFWAHHEEASPWTRTHPCGVQVLCGLQRTLPLCHLIGQPQNQGIGIIGKVLSKLSWWLQVSLNHVLHGCTIFPR